MVRCDVCECVCVPGGRRSVRACGDAKQLEICMCHESVRVCVTPDWAAKSTHTVHSGLKVRGAWGICVSNSIASGWMIGQMKGLQRDVSRAEQSNSSRQEATCICTHCCGQYWPNTSTVCGLDPPKPKPNQIQLVPKPISGTSWIPMKLINPRWHIFWCKNLLKLKSELQINRQHRFIAKWGMSWRRIAGLLDC